VELLGDDRCLRVDGADNSRREESETLYGDVVEEEDECSSKSDRAEDTSQDLCHVDLVQDFRRSHTLRLDARNREIFLFLREPPGGGRAVSQSEEGDKRKAAGNDAFNRKDPTKPRCQYFSARIIGGMICQFQSSAIHEIWIWNRYVQLQMRVTERRAQVEIRTFSTI